MSGEQEQDRPSEPGARSLEDVLVEWYRQVDSGVHPDREKFLEEHPELSAEIKEFFANEEFAANLGIELGSVSDFAREPAYEALFTNKALGDYEIDGEIARGGMGIVCRARQKSLNRSVALKVILSGELAAPEDRERFRREAEAAAALDHANIVPVYDFGEEHGHLYLSMRLIQGRSLAEIPLPVEDRSVFAARLMEKVARAVHYAHTEGVIHRDMKPGNILVDDSGEPFVTDFGLAKVTSDEKSLTQPGAILGTLRYLAPEQVTGKGDPSSPAVDIYGLGAVLYQLLAGHPPFRGDAPPEILKQVVEKQPPSPTSYNPALHRDLVTVCLKCLSKEPQKRYPTALAVAEDLKRFLDGKPVRARPTGLLGRISMSVKRRPFATTTLTLITLLVVLSIGLTIGYDLEVRRRADHAEALARLQKRQLYASRMNLTLGALANLEGRTVHEYLDAYFPGEQGEDLRGFEWYYLWLLAHREVRSVPLDHEGSRLEFLDGGRTLAVGMEGAGLKLWQVADLEAGAASQERRLPHVAGRMLFFTPDGRLAARAVGGTVIIWETTGWKEQGRFRIDDTLIRAIGWNPSGEQLAICCESGSVKVVDASNGKVLRTLSRQRPPYPFVVISPDGKLLVTPKSPSSLALLNLELEGDERTLELEEHGGPPACATFSPKGELLATGAADSSVVLWNTRTWESWKLPAVHTGPVRCLDFSPDGKWLASGSEDDLIQVYEVETRMKLASFLGHQNDILSLAFSPTVPLLASLGREQDVKLWRLDPESRETREHEPACLRRAREVVWALGITPDGKYLVSGDDTLAVDVWRLDEKTRHVARFGPFRDECFTGTISRDGLFIVAVKKNSVQVVWRLEEGPRGPFLVQEAEIPPGPARIRSLALAPRGRWLACTDSEAMLSVYQRSLEEGSPVWSLASRLDLPAGFGAEDDAELAFTNDGRLLAVASRSTSTVVVQDLGRQHKGHILRGHAGTARCIAFSADGTLLAAGNFEGSTNVWWLGEPGLLQRARHLSTIEGHTQAVQEVAFSPDGKRLATAGEDWSLKLWDLELLPEETTAIECLTLRGHGSPLTSVVFGPEGRVLVSSSGRTGILGEVFLWRGASDEDVERVR